MQAIFFSNRPIFVYRPAFAYQTVFACRTVIAPAAALALALLAAGCGPKYEIDRPGTWRPSGANDFNLKAMIADKNDLTSGAAATTDRGNSAARAVTRLYTDRRRQLLNVSLSKIAPASDSGDTGGGGGAAPSGPPSAGAAQ